MEIFENQAGRFAQNFEFRAERFKRINQTIKADLQAPIPAEKPAGVEDPPKTAEGLEASNTFNSVFINNRNLATQPALPFLFCVNACSI